MKRAFFTFLLGFFLFCAPASAEDFRPDDRVIFTLEAENWVTTQTARVLLNVEAAVTEKTSGTMRAAMAKAVGDVTKADWRLVDFTREQDPTGMERWSARFEARLPEKELNGLAAKAKKNSEAGMQITVALIDFSPTLAEKQETISQTRAEIYKQAEKQLALLNATLSGRAFRIAEINFTGAAAPFARLNRDMNKMIAAATFAGGAESDVSSSTEKSEKVVLNAYVVLASTPQPIK